MRLPNRRDSESFAIEHLGLRFRVQVSIYPDGRLGEIFIDAEKQNSAVGALGGDVAILISLLLQHGMGAADIGHALNRDARGNAQSIVGTMVDLLAGLDREPIEQTAPADEAAE